jgi:mono/diheme cytochrome c family protein
MVAMTGSRFNLLVALASLSLTAATASPQDAGKPPRQPRQDYNSGEYLYRVFCASCHGAGGTGDGTVAGVLRVPPANLTLISAKNGGAFPRDRVFVAIDGRHRVNGHGASQMPIWGDVLKVTEGQNEAVITQRINSLVDYIETIQRKAR